MVSSSEAEELGKLETIFLAMYHLLTFPFKDLLLMKEFDTAAFSKLFSMQVEVDVIEVAFFFDHS